MEQKRNNFFQRLVNSLDTNTKGFSGRKLSAVWGNILAGALVIGYLVIGYQKDNFKSFPLVLGITYTYACLCLGLVTASNIIHFKHGGKTKDRETAKGTEPIDTP